MVYTPSGVCFRKHKQKLVSGVKFLTTNKTAQLRENENVTRNWFSVCDVLNPQHFSKYTVANWNLLASASNKLERYTCRPMRTIIPSCFSQIINKTSVTFYNPPS